MAGLDCARNETRVLSLMSALRVKPGTVALSHSDEGTGTPFMIEVEATEGQAYPANRTQASAVLAEELAQYI